MVQFAPYSIFSTAISILLIVLAVAIWRRRPGTGAIPLVIMLVGLALWTLSEAAAIALIPLAVKKITIFFSYVGITIVPASWLAFVLAYTGRGRLLSRRTIPLLFIEPGLVQIATLTNSLHHLFWADRWLGTRGGLVLIDTAYGPLFWVHAVYSYTLLLVGTIILVNAFIRSPQVYRGQMFWMLVVAFFPWVSNALFIFKWSPFPDYVDLTPLAFSISVLAVSWNMFRHRFMDIVPVARDIVVESVSDAVIVLDRDNRVVDANPSALKMITRSFKEVLGQPIAMFLVNQPHLVEKYRTIEQAQAEVELKIGEKVRTYQMQLSPLRTRQGTLVGRVIVLHDITDLKQANRKLKVAQEKAEEANQLKSQFLATMSHELRTPLNVINGFTELMLEGMAGEITDLQRGNLERVLANADHLRQMIDDLLDLAKIEAGRTEIIKRPFKVKDWFNQLVEENRPLADEKGLKFTSELDAEMPDMIIGDPGRLRQIVVNLISNAVKFTEEGEVKVVVKREAPDRWRISVSDTGIGIASYAQEFIFDRFRQIDGAPTRKYGGSGLGLAIVRDLSMMMGGGVRVKSEVGKGSTFNVLLPLTIAE